MNMPLKARSVRRTRNATLSNCSVLPQSCDVEQQQLHECRRREIDSQSCEEKRNICVGRCESLSDWPDHWRYRPNESRRDCVSDCGREYSYCKRGINT